MILPTALGCALAVMPLDAFAQHNPGLDCFDCHTTYMLAGTVFTDTMGSVTAPGVGVTLTKADGGMVTLETTNADGNIAAPLVPEGSYLVNIGSVSSRTWHAIPDQGRCNVCHQVGGNGSGVRTKRFPSLHTRIPADNMCAHCHHFPATMDIVQLMTPGVLSTARGVDPPQYCRVEVAGQVFTFDPDIMTVSTVRPDVFAPGYYSMFDVILTVAYWNGISVDYYYDSTCATHFITRINNITGNYWYHFSYDAGQGNVNEIQLRRANRWDEALWRPGVWIKVVEGEDLPGIRREYVEEIAREKVSGHLIPSVRFSINPSDFQGNPPGSGRVTVSRDFPNVLVTPHNLRAPGYSSPYSKPFQPGVVTSLDIPLSLADQGLLDTATAVFYTRFAGNHIDSYYLVGLGFPGVGMAHASGRQGFVYVTENGSYNQLPNGADPKLHMTSDINVLHAPDFSYWRWIQLGNPYYEFENPTGIDDPTVEEDYRALTRNFNLHAPYPNPFNGSARITYNLFDPGHVVLDVYSLLGQRVARLLNRNEENIGVHELTWEPQNLPSGAYLLLMYFKGHQQVRRISYIR
ncbi:MAG: T9SS type A sorting domain-containing protein [Bacteroidota bacterium]